VLGEQPRSPAKCGVATARRRLRSGLWDHRPTCRTRSRREPDPILEQPPSGAEHELKIHPSRNEPRAGQAVRPAGGADSGPRYPPKTSSRR
jgi:hypothetical protein